MPVKRGKAKIYAEKGRERVRQTEDKVYKKREGENEEGRVKNTER